MEEVGLEGRRRVRPHAAARAGRLRLRPGLADRRDRPRSAVGAVDGGALPRARVALRDVSRGGALRDRGRGEGDRRPASRAHRRGDDRERRRHLRRHRRQHRPRVVHLPRGGALAGRAEARRDRAGDGRRVLVRRDGDGVRGRDDDAQELRRLPLQARRRRGAARGGGARAMRVTRRRTPSPAAAPTRTSSTCTGCAASTSRTG